MPKCSIENSPQVGEVWFADIGYDAKPRYYFIMATPDAGGRLDIFSAIQITKQFGGSPFEVTLPRVPWLSEQSYCNAQTIQPLKRTDFLRKAQGQFQPSVVIEVRKALARWLAM